MMTETAAPCGVAHDWNEEWKTVQKKRRKMDEVAFWNEFAESAGLAGFGGSSDHYVQTFLRLADIGEHESVLDMGCGNGTFSLPLGAEGHSVVACDFSPGMIEVLKTNLNTLGITTVTPLLMSWEDDWELCGVLEGSVDVALASRSLITQDLEASLLRLDKVARRRVCITLATEGTPRLDLRAMRALGLTDDPGRDFQFALNILIDHGIKPQLSYIASARVDRYASVDEAYRVYAKMVDDFYQGSSKSEKEALYVALRAWLHEHLVEDTSGASFEGTDPDKTRNTYLVFDKPRENIWAFIAWDKK